MVSIPNDGDYVHVFLGQQLHPASTIRR